MGKKKRQQVPSSPKETQRETTPIVVEPPLSFKKQVYITLVAILISYSLVFIGRYVLTGGWDSPLLQFCGEPSPATNDAYFFLAGADGFGRGVFENFSLLTNFFHRISGLSYGTLSIWLPVVLIPLVAIPICWLFTLLGHPFAGVFASVFMLSTPAFLGRTAPGCYDNDVLDFFFPIAFGTALLLVLSHLIRDTWWKKGAEKPPSGITTYKLWLFASLAGFIASSYTWCYAGRLPVNFAMLLAATIGGFFCLRKGEASRFWGAMAIIYMFVVTPWVMAFPFAATAVFAAFLREAAVKFPPPYQKYLSNGKDRIGYYLFGGFVLAGLLSGEFLPILDKFVDYIKFFGASGQSVSSVRVSLPIPSFSLSVSEIQRIPVALFVALSAYNIPFFIVCFLGISMLLILVPGAISFLPILILGLSSLFLGVRFAIFASLVWGIGFAFLFAEVLQRFIKKRSTQAIIYGFVTLLFFAIYTSPQSLNKTVVNRDFAEALCKLKGNVEKDAQAWSWWDWGYAIAYHARVLPFVDGGINELGCYLSAVVHSTNSTKTAASVMKYVATTQVINAMNNRERARWDKEFAKRYELLGYNSFQAMVPIHQLNNPDFLDNTLSKILASLEEKPQMPPQYLVLSWDNIRISYWITYFGTWDTHTLKPRFSIGSLLLPQGSYLIDWGKGTLKFQNVTVLLHSVDLLNAEGLHRKRFPHDGGYTLVGNEITGETYLLHNSVSQTMMYRMLVEDPRIFNEYFELVVEAFPMARIYKLKS